MPRTPVRGPVSLGSVPTDGHKVAATGDGSSTQGARRCLWDRQEATLWEAKKTNVGPNMSSFFFLLFFSFLFSAHSEVSGHLPPCDSLHWHHIRVMEGEACHLWFTEPGKHADTSLGDARANTVTLASPVQLMRGGNPCRWNGSQRSPTFQTSRTTSWQPLGKRCS